MKKLIKFPIELPSPCCALPVDATRSSAPNGIDQEVKHRCMNYQLLLTLLLNLGLPLPPLLLSPLADFRLS